MLRLIKDAAVSIALCAGLIAICVGLVNALPEGVGMAMMFIPILVPAILGFVFLGPVIVVVTGSFRGRPGYALGPMLLFALAPVIALVDLSLNSAKAQEQDFWNLAAPLAAPQTIILENEGTSCREACLALLAQRGDTVIAVEGHSTRRPVQYVRKMGAACDPATIAKSEKAGRWRYSSIYGVADFAAMGVVDACWDSQNIEAAPDGVVVRFRETRLRETGDIALGAFRGEVFELIERRDGKETLLGRRIDGKISTHVPGVLLLPSHFLGIHLKAERIGSDQAKAEFYRAAFGVETKPATPQGAQLAASLEKLRQIVELSGQYHEGAMDIFEKLAGKIENDDVRTAFPAIRRLMMQKDWEAYRRGVSLLYIYGDIDEKAQKAEIGQLLRSDNPEDLAFGLMRLRLYEFERLAPEYEPAIERALNSSDPDIVFAALVALGNKSPLERAFALPLVEKVAAARTKDNTFLDNPLKEVLQTTSD